MKKAPPNNNSRGGGSNEPQPPTLSSAAARASESAQRNESNPPPAAPAADSVPPAEEHRRWMTAESGLHPPVPASRIIAAYETMEGTENRKGKIEELINNDEPPVSAAHHEESESIMKKNSKKKAEIFDDGEVPMPDHNAAMLHEQIMDEEEKNTKRYPELKSNSNVAMSADAAAALHGRGESTAQPANRGQLSPTTVPQVSTASSHPSRAHQMVGRYIHRRRSQQPVRSQRRQQPPAQVTAAPPPPQPMLPPPNDEENSPSLPTLEATLVPDIPIYEATQMSEVEHVEQDDDPWSKRYKNHIIVGLISVVLVVGGMAATIGILVGGGNNGVGEEMQPSEQTPSMTPPSVPSPFCRRLTNRTLHSPSSSLKPSPIPIFYPSNRPRNRQTPESPRRTLAPFTPIFPKRIGDDREITTSTTFYSTCPDLDYITGPMNEADADNDRLLSQEEFVDFTNAISGGYLTELGKDNSFTDMPLTLQEGYVQLSCLCGLFPNQTWGRGGCCEKDMIRVVGTEPTVQDLSYLAYVCGTMSFYLENAGAELVAPPTERPTEEPADVPMKRPTLEPTKKPIVAGAAIISPTTSPNLPAKQTLAPFAPIAPIPTTNSPTSPTSPPSDSPVSAPSSAPSTNSTISVKRECNQVLEVETPEKFFEVQVGIYQLLMESYTAKFDCMVEPQIVTLCEVINQELAGGRRWLGRLLQTRKTLLIIKFTMQYETSYGYDVDDCPRMFQTYINSNLERVAADMRSRFLPVKNAEEVILFNTNKPTTSPSLIGGSQFPSTSPTAEENCYSREYHQRLTVSVPQTFDMDQVAKFQYLYQQYTENFRYEVSDPQIFSECLVLSQQIGVNSVRGARAKMFHVRDLSLDFFSSILRRGDDDGKHSENDNSHDSSRQLQSSSSSTPTSTGYPLTMRFTMQYGARVGVYDISTYNQLFTEYINSSLTKVVEDLTLLGLPVVSAGDLFILQA